MILAEEPHLAERMTLVVDVGTNAEIVLGDRAPAARRVEPDRSRLRGRPDLGRPAGRAGRHRARPDRPRRRSSRASGSSASTPGRTSRRSPRASPRPGISGICGSGIIEVVAEMFLAGHRHRGRRHRRRARGADAADRAGRPDVQLRPPRRRRVGDLAADRHHPERRARDPAGQGRALRRRPAADGPARHRRGRRDPPGRRVRQPDRPDPRDDPRAHPRLRPGPRPVGRQRGRDRGAHRAAVGRRADRDRGRRPPGREDRDRRRAALPAALRRGDGVPAQDGRLPAPRRGRSTCRNAPRRPPPRPRTHATSAAAGGAWRSATREDG